MTAIDMDTSYPAYKRSVMPDRDFKRLSELIRTLCGIVISDSKKVMLETRLMKRLMKLNIKSFTEYCDYLFSPQGEKEEFINLINVITTHETRFFREPAHFDYLMQTALPTLIDSQGISVRKNIRVWSAGCSTGEEPYTLAMLMSEFVEEHPVFFLIIGTDISTIILKKARQGIYSMEKLNPIAQSLKEKYLLKSKNPQKKLARIAPELRSRVKFCRFNFISDDYSVLEPMDIIFFRNVLIYFDWPTKEKILNRLWYSLNPGGYLFVGHSEAFSHIDIPFKRLRPSIYMKPE